MKASELFKKFPKKLKTIQELRKVITTRSDQNPNFCLFLGAGASRSSNIQTAGEMVKTWRKDAYISLSGDSTEKSTEEMTGWLKTNAPEWYDENREYCSLIERFYPLQTNRRKFIEKEVAEKVPSIGYAYLVRVAEAGLIRTIFTTNFDDLLNEAFYQFSSERAIVCAHDSSVSTISITSRRTKIVKLHGDYLFDELKNTARETNSLEGNMKEKLSEFLKEYGLILSGYSGSDKSIMRILEDMLDNNLYLQNGLYWCFREDDLVNQDVLDVLSRTNSFYVLTPGFDELMADFYSMLGSDATPFNAKLASDRASSVIESYLQNEQLKRSSSRVIKKHLEILESDKNASLLSDMMRDLNSDRIASAGLTDQNLLVYLEIERALKDRDPEVALARLGEELLKTVDKRFKEILLHRKYLCSMRLNKISDAKAAIGEMQSLDPCNYFIALSDCALLEKRADRVTHLQRLSTAHPYSAVVLNKFADELRDAIEAGDKLGVGLKADDIPSALNRSLELDPDLDNPAWSVLFSFHAKQKKSIKSKEQLIKIVDTHLGRNPFCVETSRILLRFCKLQKTTDYRGKGLFEYIENAYLRHFPKEYSAHIENIVEACIEFGNIVPLQHLLEDARSKEELKNDSGFIGTVMEVLYDVCRDLPSAISFGRDSLKGGKKPSVEIRLLRYYLQNGATAKAREIHSSLKGAIDISQWLQLDATIMEHEGRCQNAIDTIEALPDRREFAERNTANLSFLELKLGFWQKAVTRCKDFLQPRAFNTRFEAEIINYEFGKKMDSRRVDARRISEISEQTEDQMVKGVCCSLLDQDETALQIFRKEAEKRFSRIDDCLRWPVVAHLNSDLLAIREELVRAKRSFSQISDLQK